MSCKIYSLSFEMFRLSNSAVRKSPSLDYCTSRFPSLLFSIFIISELYNFLLRAGENEPSRLRLRRPVQRSFPHPEASLQPFQVRASVAPSCFLHNPHCSFVLVDKAWWYETDSLHLLLDDPHPAVHSDLWRLLTLGLGEVCQLSFVWSFCLYLLSHVSLHGNCHLVDDGFHDVSSFRCFSRGFSHVHGHGIPWQEEKQPRRHQTQEWQWSSCGALLYSLRHLLGLGGPQSSPYTILPSHSWSNCLMIWLLSRISIYLYLSYPTSM